MENKTTNRIPGKDILECWEIILKSQEYGAVRLIRTPDVWLDDEGEDVDSDPFLSRENGVIWAQTHLVTFNIDDGWAIRSVELAYQGGLFIRMIDQPVLPKKWCCLRGPDPSEVNSLTDEHDAPTKSEVYDGWNRSVQCTSDEIAKMEVGEVREVRWSNWGEIAHMSDEEAEAVGALNDNADPEKLAA